MHNDNTISKPSEDRLDYKYYAYYLAQAILNINNSNQSYAIGVCGKWGDGKTSAINLALEYYKHLEQHPDLSIQKIDKLIDNNKTYNSQKKKSYRQLFELVLKFLVAASGIILAGISGYIAAKKILQFLAPYNLGFVFWILLIITILYFLVLFFIDKYYKEVPDFLRKFLYTNETAPIIKFNVWNYHSPQDIQKEFFKNLTGQLGQNSFPCDEELIKLLNKYVKSLINLPLFPVEEGEFNLKNKISSLLKDKCKDQKIIIVIDNIDRLMPDEILMVFKLVRTLADFPNFIYILAYDRTQVVEILDKQYNMNADSYIKKIVQTEKSLPIISKQRLADLFFNKIKDCPLSDEVKEDLKLFLDEVVLNRYISNIRDIYKFLNVFDFNYAVYKNENLNLYDLIGISIAETFDKNLYQFIKDHKDKLCLGYGLELIKDKYIFENRYFLGFLFPNSFKRASILISKQPESEEDKALQNLQLTLGRLSARNSSYRRIFNEAFFDNYFKANLGKEYILQQEIDSLLNTLDKPEDFAVKFLEVYKNNPAKIIDFVTYWDTDYNKAYNTPDNVLKLMKNFLLIKTDDRNFYSNNHSTADVIKNMAKNECRIRDVLSVVDKTKTNFKTFLYPYILILCHVTKFPQTNPPQLKEQEQKLLNKICSYFNNNLDFSAIAKEKRPYLCLEYLYKYLECQTSVLNIVDELLKPENEDVLVEVLKDSRNSYTISDSEYARIAKFFKEIGKDKELKQRLITIYKKGSKDEKYMVSDGYESINIVDKILYNVLEIDGLWGNVAIIKFFNQEIRNEDDELAFLQALEAKLSTYSDEDLKIVKNLLKEKGLVPEDRRLTSQKKPYYVKKYPVFSAVLDKLEYILGADQNS